MCYPWHFLLQNSLFHKMNRLHGRGLRVWYCFYHKYREFCGMSKISLRTASAYRWFPEENFCAPFRFEDIDVNTFQGSYDICRGWSRILRRYVECFRLSECPSSTSTLWVDSVAHVTTFVAFVLNRAVFLLDNKSRELFGTSSESLRIFLCVRNTCVMFSFYHQNYWNRR